MSSTATAPPSQPPGAPPIHETLIDSPMAWSGPEMNRQDGWIIEFTPPQLAEIDAALRHAQQAGADIETMDAGMFPLPGVAPFLHAQIPDIQDGRGFIVLRGLPVYRYTDEEAGLIFYGIGLHLGSAVAQNPRGDLLGHVFDQGKAFGVLNVRGYETNAHLPFHCDGCDVVGLLCLRKARAGGYSSVVSSLQLHNEVLQRRPDLLPVLYRGFYYIKREAAHTDSPVTKRPLPVFGVDGDTVSCYFNPPKIEAAYKVLGQPMTPIEQDAFDLMVELAKDPSIHLDMDLEAGDMQFCNNYTVMHSRTDFEDWPESEKRRHMLRLWLVMQERRQLPASFSPLDGYRRNQLARLSDL